MLLEVHSRKFMLTGRLYQAPLDIHYRTITQTCRSQTISCVLHYSALISAIPRYSATYTTFVSIYSSVFSMHGCIVFALFILFSISYFLGFFVVVVDSGTTV